MKTKVAINVDYGGFSLSKEAVLLGRKLSGDSKWGGLVLNGEVYDDGSLCDLGEYGCHLEYDFPRHDPVLVQVIEKLGSEAGGRLSNLAIKEIDGNLYRITEYDGWEHVETPFTIEWVEVSGWDSLTEDGKPYER